jgi:VWFA-related protein
MEPSGMENVRRVSLTIALVYSLTFTSVFARNLEATDPVFRERVDRFLLDVTVSNGSGRAVTSLTAQDFAIFDNKVAQTIASVEFVPSGALLNLDHGPKSSSPTPSSSHEQANPTPARLAHFHTIVIDDLNLAADHVTAIKSALYALIDREASLDDYFAIVTTGRPPKDWCDFTNNRHVLRDAVQSISWNPLSSQQLGNGEPTMWDLARERFSDGSRLTQPVLAHRSQLGYEGCMKVLHQVISRLTQIPGRRSLVLLSDALPQAAQLEGLIEFANRNWVSISTISSRGVDYVDVGAQDLANIPGGLPIVRQELAERAEVSSQFTESLRRLALGTGGMPFVSNDISNALTQAADNSRGYYLISFKPAAIAGPESAAHKISIKLLPRGLTAHARSSFYSFPSSAVLKP